MQNILVASISGQVTTFLIIGIAAIFGFSVFLLLTLYRKVEKGTALIRTGVGGTRVVFNGCLLYTSDAADE